MRIILPLLQDPTDVVVQGEAIGDSSAMDWQLALSKAVKVFDSTALFPIIQGDVIGDKIMDSPIPCAMIGQHNWYGIKPRTTGPEVMSGGELVMLVIGKIPNKILVDPTQEWLLSAVPLDSTGALLNMSPILGSEQVSYETCRGLIGEMDGSVVGFPVTYLLREEITRSGLAKRVTSPTLPDDFNRRNLIDDFTESTRKWFVEGVARNLDTGLPLSGCRVIIMESDKIGKVTNPIIADLISDAEGKYSIQVNHNRYFQIFGYLAGSPDISGITLNTVSPENK